MSFFPSAGRKITTGVPTGQFKLKFANGDTGWGESNLFGGSTGIQQTNPITFNRTTGHTIDLTPRGTSEIYGPF
jgi:hypothetical protein